MREEYLAASPYNLVRIILGKAEPGDTATENVYTRAAALLAEWLREGVLTQDVEPGFYAYFQQFADPETGEALVRKGLIAAGEVVDYSAGIVHRHEQTLHGPKKDRLTLLRHTEAHFGQIFMLYEDPEAVVDRILDLTAQNVPLGDVEDEHGTRHLLWRIADKSLVAQIQGAMSDKKLVIADGHHRYETALQFSRESGLDDAKRVMMTLVNMCSPGLRILATHRILRNLDGFDPFALLDGLRKLGDVRIQAIDDFRAEFAQREHDVLAMGVAVGGTDGIYVLRAGRTAGMLDVRFLHEQVLGGILGISEEAVREQRNLEYARGIDTAMQAVRSGGAQAAFLLQPTQIGEVAQVSLGGGVMPQKSTDFYPKLLSGLTIYKLER